MEREDALREFQREWETFLTRREHSVGAPRGIRCVLKSKDEAGKTYRWLLLAATGKSRTLSRAERQDVESHLRRGRALRQRVYVTVRFDKPDRKVIALPAARALERKRIVPSKGGIPFKYYFEWPYYSHLCSTDVFAPYFEMWRRGCRCAFGERTLTVGRSA